MFGGFDIPREQLEAGYEAYEDQLNKCARGEHSPQHVSFEWSYEGSLDVPNGTRDFKVYHCSFCHAEWT